MHLRGFCFYFFSGIFLCAQGDSRFFLDVYKKQGRVYPHLFKEVDYGGMGEKMWEGLSKRLKERKQVGEFWLLVADGPLKTKKFLHHPAQGAGEVFKKSSPILLRQKDIVEMLEADLQKKRMGYRLYGLEIGENPLFFGSEIGKMLLDIYIEEKKNVDKGEWRSFFGGIVVTLLFYLFARLCIKLSKKKQEKVDTAPSNAPS